MRSHKTILANLVSYLVVIVLLLLTAVLADAQTQNAAQTQIGLIEKTAVESKPSEPSSSGTDTKPGATKSEAQPTKPDAETVKSTADAADIKPEVPESQPTNSAQPLLPQAQCKRTINADVLALQQPFMLNRLGAAIPSGLVFALKGDTVSSPQAQLKPNKRPRPLVLRANVGDCLTIKLTNLIPADAFKITPAPPAPVPPFDTSEISIHVQGMEWVTGSKDDGSFVGKNNSSLASVTSPPTPGPNVQTYTLFARQEGTFLLYTMGDTSSIGNQLTRGLFGAVNVQPAGAEWYRSQVTADDLALATYNANSLPAGATLGAGSCTSATPCDFTAPGKPVVKVIKTAGGFLNTLDNHPVINYNATYASGTPILKMLDGGNNIVHSDLTALITGPNAGRFPGTTGVNTPEPPCNAERNAALGLGPVDPLFCANPAAPDRKQPYREFTIIYHGGLGPIATQAFPVFSDPNMSATLEAGQDAFAINYGTGGIGAEVYANRIGVGPMGECADCKFEEFFLSAWSVGDPAMLVDRPANVNVQPPLPPSPAQPPLPPPPPLCTNTDLGETTPATNPNPNCANSRVPPLPTGPPYILAPLAKATRAYYPDDPSNVYHSYINDHLKFRILHGGRDVTHVHHQHAHQWLQSPNSDEASYLDSQMISPGASYTLEMVYNGSGNRNKVVGDSIFHCHFYPHFAAGMWAMWRTHDAFEAGTYVYPEGKQISGKDVSGQVVPGARGLPDGEIITGSPNPALVPLPSIPMAPLPAYVQIQNNVKVDDLQTTAGGQVVIGGTCQANKINGLDVIGGCVNGTKLNGTVLNSQFDGTQMTGQFQPSPQVGNPGFPFFIPGIAGARAPHPPLDFAPDGAGGFLDGGLPRHVVVSGAIEVESHDKFDWSKDLKTMEAAQLPELGTVVEQAAMAFHGKRCYATFFPDGTPGSCPSSNSTPPQSTINTPPTGFLLNGLPRKNAVGNSAEQLGAQPGSPYADPAIDDNGAAVGTVRRYKAAAIQLNVTFNKKGWHFPQQRILTLWKDAQPTIDFTNGRSGRRPEPLFFRGNSGDIIEYWHTNLVPNYYLVDDFQVRTPTDILGQHIHLVKFDVTSSDGAGNGFNYEDGTFSPEEVQDMIAAINTSGGLLVGGVKQLLPAAKNPPKDIFDCTANPGALRCQLCPHDPTPDQPECLSWRGAQTTIQRWYIDPLVDDSGVDRTLRTVFTHDHFGPSTHQQAGLYAGLVVEPTNSTWTSNDGATTFGTRSDGGPTSWEARIITRNNADSYREFLLEFQDLQLAYSWATYGTSPPRTAPDPDPKKGWIDPAYAINPPPTQSLVTTGIPDIPAGTQSVNYLNEPLGFRVGSSTTLGNHDFTDLSYAFDNSIQPIVNPLDSPDPVTPLMRAYQNDNVQVRVLVGAHVFSHQFSLEGPRWFAEPSWKNSGYRSSQAMGLSEHFELLFKAPSSSAPTTGRKCPDKLSQANCTDYLYSPSRDSSGLANGLWGLFRSYVPSVVAKKLQPLPNNPIGGNVSYVTCKPGAPKRTYNITAVSSQKALASQAPFPGSIVFNGRGNAVDTLTNRLGIMYVRNEDLDGSGKLKTGVPVEPLVLRANAGDCIDVNLTNGIPDNASIYDADFKMAAPLTGKPYPIKVSRYVGLHPQLLSFDGAQSNGINVGWNSKDQKDQVVPFGQTIKYQWYAGTNDRDASGNQEYKAVEFGALNLFPSDPVFQHINGLFGSMIIEPEGSTSWLCGEPGATRDCYPGAAGPSPTTRTSATITMADGNKFREFATMISDEMNISPTIGGNVANNGAVNYRAEPWQYRYVGNSTRDFSCMLSNQLVNAEPQTPIFRAVAGDKVRFRLTHPFGTGTSQVFTVHGHVWQRNPFKNESTAIGDNNLSQWIGSRDNHGSTDHFDLVIDKAGGEGGQTGDYLYTVFVPIQARTGAWGLFRVSKEGVNDPPVVTNGACKPILVTPGYVPPAPDDGLERFIRKSPNTGTKP